MTRGVLSAQTNSQDSNFLHPVVREFVLRDQTAGPPEGSVDDYITPGGGWAYIHKQIEKEQALSEHHVLEDFLTSFRSPDSHYHPLKDYVLSVLRQDKARLRRPGALVFVLLNRYIDTPDHGCVVAFTAAVKANRDPTTTYTADPEEVPPPGA